MLYPVHFDCTFLVHAFTGFLQSRDYASRIAHPIIPCCYFEAQTRCLIFEPGTYSVSLQVRDGSGNWSEPEVQSVKVTNEPYLSASEFPWYTQPTGTLIKDESEQWNRALSSAPQLSAMVTQSTERKRMISGESQVIRNTGLIGKQYLNGTARLFMHHSNGLAEKVMFAAVIHNPDPSKTRTVHITREGLLQPTLLHRANAREAAVNFLTQPALVESIEVKPGKTAVLMQVTLEPGQGFAAIEDIEQLKHL